jgi:hypothetical protein
MTTQQQLDPPQQSPQRRGQGLLTLGGSIGAGIATYLATHDARLSLEISSYLLAVFSCLRQDVDPTDRPPRSEMDRPPRSE